MPLRRLVLLGSLVPLGASIALAASLALNQDSLGAASLSVPRCTSAGLAVVQNLTGTNVISVTVSNIPPACANATLQATVNNTVTSSGGSVTVPAGGGAATVALGTPVAILGVHEIDLLLTGP